MADSSRKQPERGLPEGLRAAIERTFAATTEGAAETRERAEAALDEVARRGREAREAVAERAQEARESSSGAATKVIEAIEGMRLASRDDLRVLSERVEELARRVEELENKAKVKG
jgi:polyhydroxyalkanoate synthesis regulator phasin